MAKNKMETGKFTGRAQKQRKSAKRPAETPTSRLAAQKRTTETGAKSVELRPTTQKLYSIFLEKLRFPKAEPWVARRSERNSPIHKKAQE